MAITAFSANDLELRAASTIADIGKFTPNMTFESASAISGSSSSVTIFIRGIGQTDFTETIDPGVGLYVDGVYISRSVGALLDTVDISNIEVLRGPQGTLFGKNTIGGAVVLTTKQPSDDFDATLEATTGSYSRSDIKGEVNVPVTDKFFIRASAAYLARDGYVERLSDGQEMGNQNSISGRISAVLEPTDDLKFTTSIDGTNKDEEDLGTTLLAAYPQDQFPAFYNAVYSGSPCTSPTDKRCFGNQWVTGNPYTTWNSSPNHSTLHLWGASLVADWDIGNNLNLGDVHLKTISSYRQLVSRFDQDSSNSPLPIADSLDDYTQRQYSQEIQLTGSAFDNKLKWTTGAYFLKEMGVDRNYLIFSIADFLSGGYVDNDSYAGYVQGTYDLTDALSLTFGGRYTFEDKRFLPDQYIEEDKTGGGLFALSQLLIPPSENPNGNRILPFEQKTAMANEFTPTISVDYKIAPDILAYVSFNKGFKSGGFTQRVFPPEPAIPSFGPEYVDSYEFGFKTEFFDKRLRLNAAAFFTDYTAIQEIVNDGIAPTVHNAGKANINGFELEADAAATSWLRLNAAVGFTDAGYRQVSLSAQEEGVLPGNQLPYAPRWTATIGGDADIWTIPLGTLSARVDWSYRSSFYLDAVNTPDLRQSAYSIVNLGTTFKSSDDFWEVTIGGTNVASTKYLITGFSSSAIGATYGAYARPAEWYLRLKAKY